MAWRFWPIGRKLPDKPSPEDVEAMRWMAKKRKPVVLLRPRRAESPLSAVASKMGGRPDLPRGAEWPQCPFCRVPLNFVMQLFRRDFPEFPFPPQTDLASLFRCPHRRECGGREYRQADQYTAWRFFNATGDGALVPRDMPRLPDAPTVYPKHVLQRYAEQGRSEIPESIQRIWAPYDPPVPECLLDPLRTGDWPHGYEDSAEWWGEVFENFRRRHTDEEGYHFSKVFDEFTDHCTAREATKIGGFAAWQQGARYPTCACGRRKEFFFQLSSRDRDRGPEAEAADNPSVDDDYRSSDHGIMIGDAGNIYFFMCPACGADGIESNWDCG
jgi:hypothetical protein